MELEGLKRCLAELQEGKIDVVCLTTDRHKQINTYLRMEHPRIAHMFDPWHIAKGNNSITHLSKLWYSDSSEHNCSVCLSKEMATPTLYSRYKQNIGCLSVVSLVCCAKTWHSSLK